MVSEKVNVIVKLVGCVSFSYRDRTFVKGQPKSMSLSKTEFDYLKNTGHFSFTYPKAKPAVKAGKKEEAAVEETSESIIKKSGKKIKGRK